MRSARLVGFAAILSLGVALISAAEQLDNTKQLGNTTLDKSFEKTRELRNEWTQGRAKPNLKDPLEVEAIDTIAQWYAYRLTWVKYQSDNGMAELAKQFDGEFINECLKPPDSKEKKEFLAAIGKPFAKRFKEVLDKDFSEYTQAVVNAALMVGKLAKLKQEDVGDMLVEVIKDEKQHDAVKVHAVRALREFFPVKALDEESDAKSKKKTRDLERIAVLVDFIERKWPASEDKMEQDYVHYVRREAIMSLAQAGVPAVLAIKKRTNPEGVLEGEVASTLLKIVQGKIDPPASLAEKCEAAIGVLNFKTELVPEYDPRPGLFVVGNFLLEFKEEYRKDWINFAKKGGKQPFIPWKTQADRLKNGFTAAVTAAKKLPGAEAAEKFEKESRQILSKMSDYQPIDNTADLEAALTIVRPASGALYGDKIKGPTINLPD